MMNRKDTIIVAVLVNAALLSLLFMLAVKVDDDVSPVKPLVQREISSPISLPKQEVIATKSHDELDGIIKTYKQQTLSREVPKAIVKSTPKKKENHVTITVKRGDNLEKIAKTNGTTVSAIMKENNLTSDRISIGDELKISLKAIVNGEKRSEPEYYVMKSGDNPWNVAKQFHVGFNDLLKLNDLDESRARSLKPGDKLRVK